MMFDKVIYKSILKDIFVILHIRQNSNITTNKNNIL